MYVHCRINVSVCVRGVVRYSDFENESCQSLPFDLSRRAVAVSGVKWAALGARPGLPDGIFSNQKIPIWEN
jgi:hypothetical protein